MQMANENLKAQKIYGKYIKDLPQVTELNDTDDIIVEDSTPITSRAKLGVLFDSIKKRIASTWRFVELNNQTIMEYASELDSNKIGNKDNLISILATNAKKVEDCLTQTTESGVYRWYSAKNQPSTGGYIIVFKYNSNTSMRLALADNGIYYSTYNAGVSYGSWEKL